MLGGWNGLDASTGSAKVRAVAGRYPRVKVRSASASEKNKPTT
jgi:hypothetical protein